MTTPWTGRDDARMLLVAWAVAFCLLTLLAGVGGSIAGGIERKALPSVIAVLGLSPALLTTLVVHLAVYLCLHVLVALAWYWAWVPIDARLWLGGQRRARMLLSFLPVLLLLLLLNAKSFPASLFSPDFAPVVEVVATASTWILAVFVSMVAVTGAWLRVMRSPVAGMAAMGACGLLVAWWVIDPGPRSVDMGVHRDPDVIFIGVDGLRPDHVDPALSPAIAGLVSEGIRVERAWTPLARTFPAWVSVLTGSYPATHGAYFNLMRRDLVDDTGSLAHQLGELGYQRLYAIDETRFSNMDRSYGFDQMVGPPIGGFDFMMGIVGDLPLMNLLASTRAGGHLFPFAHGNRALAATYRPETFDAALRRALLRVDPDRPLFLLVHFELPHWPFSWADDRAFRLDAPDDLSDKSLVSYQRTVARADVQVASLLSTLESTGRLENAILVMMSDHGQAFFGYEPGWHAGSTTGTVMTPSVGHGTHVMSESQYQVVLAFRGYGSMDITRLTGGASIPVTASLVDVRPTLHDWLGLRPPPDVVMEGKSLWPHMQGTREVVRDESVVFIETGFSPASIRAGDPDRSELLAEFARYYRVSRDGRLFLREGLLPELRRSKQYAAVSGDWLLAAMPATDGSVRRELLLGDLETRVYWNLTLGDAPPADAPVPALHAALCTYVVMEPAMVPCP